MTQSADFLSAFHDEFPVRDADLASVGLKGTSDKSWSLCFNDRRILKKSVSDMALIDFLEQHDARRLRSVNSKSGVVTAIYSVIGGLTYAGYSRLDGTGGVQLDPTPTGPLKIMAGCEYTVTDSGQVVLPESDRVERMIGIGRDIRDEGAGNPEDLET